MKPFSLVSLLSLAALQISLCQGATIPSGAITVDLNGAGKYTTITAALADTSSNIYYIYAGNYTEAVVISRAGVTIYGATSNTNAYASNTVTISHDEDSTQAGGDDPSGTVRVSSAATGVSLYNLNIENTYVGSQAIALGVQGTEFACYACQLRGYQDTLYVEVGYQFYSGCLITGAVDFIFGKPGASAWITGSTITTVGNGCITASGRDSDDASYYVINDSTVTSTKYVNYLGRPWGDYARVIFQNSYLGSNIAAAGWSEWSTATPNTEDVTYGEYNNTGPGDWNSARASFATELAAPIAINTVIPSTSWINSAWLTGAPSTTTTTSKATTSTTTTSKATTSTTTTMVTTTTTTTTTSSSTVPDYGQCGGIGYTGSTTCASPYVCTYSNDYYSQCL